MVMYFNSIIDHVFKYRFEVIEKDFIIDLLIERDFLLL